MSAALTLSGVGKTFVIHRRGTNLTACRDVSLDVEHGTFVGITGKSGSGKSTVLKLVYRTYLPQTGTIVYDSDAYGTIDLAQAEERRVMYLRRHEIGYVSQFLHVIPRTTAREIVERACLERGDGPDTAHEQAQALLAHFEIADELWDSYPATFSGGEKLRLNVARAMAMRPRLLLLDEPTASLDDHSKTRVRELLERLKSEGTTMLGIFHDLPFMGGLCDKEYTMADGRLSQAVDQKAGNQEAVDQKAAARFAGGAGKPAP